MSSYLRASLKALEQTHSFSVLSNSSFVRLDKNEAPYALEGPLEAAKRAISRDDVRLYPNPLGEPLRTALAKRHGIEPSQVLVSGGADQLLAWCVRAFVDPGETVVTTSPCYSFFRKLVNLWGARHVETPLGPDGAIPKSFSTEPAKLRFLTNPAAWTGTWRPVHEIKSLVEESAGVVIIDEAYVDFAPEDCLSLLSQQQNCVIVRTFSKGHALAGLRVGYAVASADLVRDLHLVKDPSPVSSFAILAARAAIEAVVEKQELIQAVARARNALTSTLREMGWRVPSSFANFVLASPPAENGRRVLERLQAAGIAVNGVEWLGLYWLRMTIGSSEEIRALERALATCT